MKQDGPPSTNGCSSDFSGFAALFLDHGGQVAGVTALAEEMFAANIVGKMFKDLLSAEERQLAEVKVAEAVGRSLPAAMSCTFSGLESRAALIVPFPDRVMVVFPGVSGNEDNLRKRLETTEAELAGTKRELDDLCFSVSHDLRNPLVLMDGFSQALIEDHAAELSEEAKFFLKRIRAAGRRMAQLIDDLLSLSRIMRGAIAIQPVDLSSVMRTVAQEILAKVPERKVELVISEGLRAMGDPRLLRLALEHLLGNALKFTGNADSARIEFGSSCSDGEEIFCIRDNGAGFDMAYADKLFVPFQRLHAPENFSGSGIGLAIVQRIIHRHGGRIWGEGSPGKGAAFFFTLKS